MLKLSEDYSGRVETGDGERLSRIIENRESEMDMRGTNKARPEVIPPRSYMIVRRASFRCRSKRVARIHLEALGGVHDKYLARKP